MKPNTPADSATSFAARLATLATALSFTGGVAQAQLTWNSAGPTDDWSTAAGNENWSPGVVVWTQNSNAVFDGGSGTPESIAVTTANIFNNLTFDVSDFVITSTGAGSLVLSTDLASTITVTQAGDTATLNETLANNNGINSSLTKAGPGTLVLFGTAPNTYTGGLSVSQGTLVASHEGALGTGPVTVAGGATLDLNKGNVTFTGLANSLSGSGTVRVTALGTAAQTVNLNGDHSSFTGNLIVGTGAAPGAGKIRLDGADNPATTLTIEPNATIFSSAGVRSTPVTLKGGDTGESLGQLRIDFVGTEWAGPVILDGAMSGAGDGIIGTNSGPVTLSGTISELNGPRDLTKSGGGTLILTATNTHSGATRSFAGNLSVASIRNAGVAGPLGSGSVLGFGNLGTGSTLFYTGGGETTDRVFDLGGNNGNGGINNLGSGPLVFTSNFTASGSGTKTLVLTAVEGPATGEISGSIPDHAALGTTALAASFLAGVNTVTLASVEGVIVGAGIAGEGIAGGTTITAINTGTRVVTLSAVTSGPGTNGQTMTVDGVINRTLVTKNDTGTWTLSGANTYSGQTLVNAGVLRVTHGEALGTAAGNTRVVGNITGLGRVEISGGLTLADSFLIDSRQQGSLNVPALSSVAGNNTITGQIQGQTGGSTYNVESRAGSFLTLTGGFTLVNATTGASRFLQLLGEGDGLISGEISNGTGTPTVNKQGSGTWTLSGPNTYTGATNVNGGTLVLAGTAANASNRSVNSGTLVISGDYSGAGGTTTVNGGTLRLDYSTTDTSKLPDGGILILSGGTLELAGGSHAEAVLSTTLAPGKSTLVTRSSGNARLDLRDVTSAGTVVLAQSGIATTNNGNTNGILPWARVLVGGSPVLATNSTDSFDGPIVPYTGFTNVNRLGPGTLPNGIVNNVRIVDGGSTGNLGLSAPLTAINFLQMAATGGPSTIDPAPGEILMIGDEAGGTVWQSAGAGGLTLGTAVDDGILTTGNTDNATTATLSILNEGSTPLTVNSTIANNGSDPVGVVLGGSGEILLAGNNTFTGTLVSTITTGLLSGSNNALGGITISGGTLTLSANNSFTTALTVNSGGTAILTGNNIGRPGNLATRTVVNSGGVMQLQANAGNSAAGVSTVLSSEQTGTVQPFNLFSGGLLQLRSDDSVTFAGGNNVGGLNNASVTIDVNNSNGTATGQTLGFAPGNLPYGNAVTVNTTGGHGYKLALGTFRNITATASVLTLNPTTADLLIGGYSNQQANANNSTLTLAGTSAASEVTGPITNQSPTTPTGTGVVNVIKNGNSTWTLSGASTYTGTTTVNAGILKANNTTALGTTSSLNVAGTGTLDLNGTNLTLPAMAAGAATATVTDNSSVAGTSTLALSAQTPTVTIATRITDGPTRAVRMSLRNANAGNTPFTLTNPNTFSGGLLLANGTGSGTRLRITGAPVTVGTAGAIVSSPFGTGPIIIGEAPTDKAGVLLDSAGNYTIANDIVFNTALGTDQPGIRLDTTGHTFSGTITANLSNALFGNVGSARLTGRVTGTNGLQLNASAVTITLANATANPNDYAGDTTIGLGATLVMGAANQLPNGALKGNLVANGTLNLAGFGQTVNGLSGTGTLSSSSGAPTLAFGGNNTSATFTGNTAGTLGINKVGSGLIALAGTLAHLGDTTVTQGTLAIVAPSTFADGADVRLNTGGTLNLAAGTDVIDQLFINGASQNPGKWGRPGSISALGADFESALLGGDGLLSVTSSGGSPYSSWISSFFPGETDPAIIGQTADPDKDGVDNLTEFAFDGDPTDGGENGQIHVFAADSNVDGDTNKELILTAAIRSGTAAFASGAPSTAASVADGITYSIQGSTNLAGFTTTVNPVPTAITTGLPALNPGYSYRSFSLSGSNGLPSKGFLRAAVTAP